MLLAHGEFAKLFGPGKIILPRAIRNGTEEQEFAFEIFAIFENFLFHPRGRLMDSDFGGGTPFFRAHILDLHNFQVMGNKFFKSGVPTMGRGNAGRKRTEDRGPGNSPKFGAMITYAVFVPLHGGTHHTRTHIFHSTRGAGQEGPIDGASAKSRNIYVGVGGSAHFNHCLQKTCPAFLERPRRRLLVQVSSWHARQGLVKPSGVGAGGSEVEVRVERQKMGFGVKFA